MAATDVDSDRRDAGADAATAADQKCYLTGPCLRCEQDELLEAYCLESGRRQEVTCNSQDALNKRVQADADHTPIVSAVARADADASGLLHDLAGSVTYQRCLRTEQDEMAAFAMWWLAWLAVGIAACVCIRKRKQKTMTLYERRARA